jgi:hypothetical protein
MIGDHTGWLLAVGDRGETLLAGSRMVSGQIAEITGEPAEFPAHPRIVWPLCGPGWLACGTGALSFDPLCGVGSGHAVREAILAAAVLRPFTRAETARGYWRTTGLAWWPASCAIWKHVKAFIERADVRRGGRHSSSPCAVVWNGAVGNWGGVSTCATSFSDSTSKRWSWGIRVPLIVHITLFDWTQSRCWHMIRAIDHRPLVSGDGCRRLSPGRHCE